LVFTFKIKRQGHPYIYIPAGTVFCYGTQLVMALCYNRQGRGVVSRWGHSHFSLYK